MTSHEIRSLNGPILVLGGSGFVGAAMMHELLRHRDDVYGTVQRLPAWRLADVPMEKIIRGDLLNANSLRDIFSTYQPKTIFNCLAYGGYSFQKDAELIYDTNFGLATRILRILEHRDFAAYVSCGSSSEYGHNSEAPSETDPLEPNSHYSVSKCATANLLRYYGKTLRKPVVNLRLYSVYGPLEDAARLIPKIVSSAAQKKLPPFVAPEISRDFVYIDDVVQALIKAALKINMVAGDSLNIGTGVRTSMADIAETARRIFAIEEAPVFGQMENRNWDNQKWVSNPTKAAHAIGWHATTDLEAGLQQTYAWYTSLSDKEFYGRASKSVQVNQRNSISAIIACYGDGKAIPIMWQRLKKVFEELGLDYEIIFVNDGSPDDSEEVIRGISEQDRRVIGISHARNFGSQAAFRSGMTVAKKSSCVLLDGDLQDPPEVIAEFVEKWRQGFDVVYGRRVTREATWFMNQCYKGFYRLFNWMSYVPVPKDAGDFSLIDRCVMDWLLKFPERDLFMRGLRAYVGFRQIGVDYIRPERMFGRSTNNLLKNIGWAKKGILSFSNVPLNLLTGFSLFMVLLSLLMASVQVLVRAIWPDLTPPGLTTIIIAVIGIGSLNLLGISVIGEYIAKIFEEVKGRPHYVRKGMIEGGKIQSENHN